MNQAVVNSAESEMCLELHQSFNQMPRIQINEIDQIPFTNGIYLLFERDEFYGGMDRIVRVGTHTSQDRLKSRLADHFVKKNKDGSIFRKNIGQALLNHIDDSYLEIWSDNSSSPARMVEKWGAAYLPARQAEIEDEVSEYLRNNLTFVCIAVDSPIDRGRWTQGMIATLNKAAGFGPSPFWLGQSCPAAEIRRSGLWQVKSLNGMPLFADEFARIQDARVNW